MPSARLEDGDVGVGVNADLCRDLETTAYDLPRWEIGVLDQCARRCESVRSTRSNRQNSIVGLDDVTSSRDDKAVLTISDSEQSFQTTQNPIAPPILCQLHRCALQVSGIPLQFFLELLKQCESIGRCARESGEQLSAVQRADFLRVRFHHSLADGDLSVTAERDLSVASDGEDRGRPDALKFPTHRFKITLPLGLRRPGKGLRCALSGAPKPQRKRYFESMSREFERVRSTTILAVRRDGQVALGGDGQVTAGQTVMKSNAQKVRTLHGGKLLAGFAGAAADAFTLFEKFEEKLERYPGNLQRAAVELAKDWRSDRVLRRLEALLAVTDKEHGFIISGTGDIIEPDDGILAIGSGGSYALAAARALVENTDLPAREIVRRALEIAAEICVYTNANITVLEPS